MNQGFIPFRVILGLAVCTIVLLAATLLNGWAGSWIPGRTHSKYSHVIATDQEGVYKPAAGYLWVDPDGPIGPVRWQPGTNHPDYDHVLAADREGYFVPEPGYTWNTPDTIGPVHRIAAGGSAGVVSNAESLRRHLARQGALSPPHGFIFADDLNESYKNYESEKTECPLPNFRDQPVTASQDAVNIFVVDFKASPQSVCRDAPNSSICLAIHDNCITVGTSVFCDFGYLDRRASIAKLAYYFAWKGLGRVQDGETAKFLPLSRDALADLARMTIAARKNIRYPQDLKIIPWADRLAEQADSSVYSLAFSVSLIAPVLHEIAHIEQSYCGRSVASGENDDLLAEFFLTGKKDYAEIARYYDQLTCSHLTRNEIDADLRGMDELLLYIEHEAPKAVKSQWFNFDDGLSTKIRRELRGLARWSREVAMLSFLYGAEYELLIFPHPEKGLALVRGEPNAKSLDPYIHYYIQAGEDPTIGRVRGHLEPAFRTVRLSRALDIKRFNHINFSRSISLAHLRIAPFSIGRFRFMRRQNCGIADTAERSKALSDYVLFAFQEVYPAGGPGDPAKLQEAYAILQRFMEPGADRKALTQAFRPRRADYAAIFNQPFADKAYRMHASHWQSGAVEISMKPDQTELVIYQVPSDELREYGFASYVQGGYEDVSRLIKPGLTIYTWVYREPGSKFGKKYDGLYFVNGRWVWIPKPYQLLRQD